MCIDVLRSCGMTKLTDWHEKTVQSGYGPDLIRFTVDD